MAPKASSAPPRSSHPASTVESDPTHSAKRITAPTAVMAAAPQDKGPSIVIPVRKKLKCSECQPPSQPNDSARGNHNHASGLRELPSVESIDLSQSTKPSDVEEDPEKQLESNGDHLFTRFSSSILSQSSMSMVALPISFLVVRQSANLPSVAFDAIKILRISRLPPI